MRAAYLDGRHARIHDAALTIGDDQLSVSGETFSRTLPLGAVEITDAIGSAPRLVRFDDGACCEPLDQAAFTRALEGEGVRRSRLSSWERSPTWIVASLAALATVLTLTYQIVIPRTARLIAERLPDAASEYIGRHTLSVLDRRVFRPTTVPAPRQAAIVREFDRLDQTVNGRRYAIQFRSSPAIGANALALPYGTIVLTDELIALAQDDREILGVLAHESGHVARRHAERRILEGSAIVLLVTWFAGDPSALAAAAPTALLQAKYSRDIEREADEYAVYLLSQSGIPTQYFASMLERLERTRGGKRAGSMLDYLSTHPATPERLQRLRQ